MCGRFAFDSPSDAMARLFDAIPANRLPPVPNFNVCPTMPIHVVRSGVSGRVLVSMRWGFIPHWYAKPNGGPLLINARAETIAEKPAFRMACRERRCLVPMSGFYEWDRSDKAAKLPWYFYRRDGQPLVCAGIWQDWGTEAEATSTVALVTTQANRAMSAVHHRMPVVLETADFGLWLGEQGKGAAPLMRPAAEDVLDGHRVSTAVNSNRASGPELIEKI